MIEYAITKLTEFLIKQDIEDKKKGKATYVKKTSAEDVYTTDNIYIGREVIVEHKDLIIEEDIETIVTKEQFSQMEYKVGDL